jgi:hypothetical protein
MENYINRISANASVDEYRLNCDKNRCVRIICASVIQVEGGGGGGGDRGGGGHKMFWSFSQQTVYGASARLNGWASSTRGG